MGNLILITLLCIVLPLLTVLVFLDKISRLVAIAMVLGCVVCLASYFVNTFLETRFQFDEYYLYTTIAPIVEETLKFIPVLIFSRILSEKNKFIIPLAFVTGIGFAILENSYLLMENFETVNVSWAILRGIGTGLMHGMSTLIIGNGIYLVKENKRVSVLGTYSSLLLAILFHATYNCLLQHGVASQFAILLPIITYICLFYVYKKEAIKEFIRN